MNFLPRILQRFVVIALLGVWFGPAASAAVPVKSAPLPTFATAPLSPLAATGTSQSANATTTTSETQSYAEREKQATELENFQGGFYLYIGGGALLLLIIILLLVL
jgi:hypothetical protein